MQPGIQRLLPNDIERVLQSANLKEFPNFRPLFFLIGSS